MELIFTKSRRFKPFWFLTALLLFQALMSFGQGTRTVADELTYSSPNVPASLVESLGPSSGYTKETVENPDNATVDDDNFARLLASPGLLLGLGSYGGEIELKYPSMRSANTTSYIRLDADGNLLDALLGGNLGELLGSLLGIVALGEQEIIVTAKNGSMDVYSRSSQDGFNIDRARLITDAAGDFYLAITPDVDYDRINISNQSLSLLGLGDEVGTDVYSVFDFDSGSICGSPLGTSYDVSGVNLDLLNLTGSAAEDLNLAIDGDESTYTSLSPGVLSLAGVLEQHFYFDGEGEASDEVMLTLSSAPGILDVDLLENIEIVAYNGTTEVARQDLETLGTNLLGIAQVDLLGLLADGNPVTFAYTPGLAFDKVVIEVGTLLNLGTSESLRVHEVVRTPGRPDIQGVDDEQNLLVCAGTDVTLLADVTTGDQVKWYDAPTAGNLVHTGASYPLGVVGSKVTYYAAAERPGCPIASIRVPVTVDINPDPLISLNGAAVYNVAIGESLVLPPATAVNEDDNPVTVSWTGLDGAPLTMPNTAGVFSAGGRYVYRASATGNTCTNYVDVVVNVFDPDECPLVYNRMYATSADDFTTSSLLGIQLGSVTNPTLAAGNNLADYSLLSETVGTSLLGLTGETSQTIRWNGMVPAGTPVTIKLGREYGAAGVSGGIYVQALDGDPVNGDDLLGIRQLADGGLVSAVNGINEFEYTFIPTDENGVPVAYNGVKVSLASLLNAVQNVRVYAAYYHETSATLATCTFGSIDIMTGFESIIDGLDVASGLTSVQDPGLSVDGDLDTYATIFNAVGANISSKLDVSFAAPVIAGDSVAIKVGSSTGLLDLNLLEGYEIQRYLGNQTVGNPIDASSNLLNLTLLGGGSTQSLNFITDVPFDRIKILSGGVVSALEELRVYEIELFPISEIPGEEYDDINDLYFIEICPGDVIDLPSLACDEIKLYDALVGGNEITPADIATWAPQTTQTVYVQIVRFGCEDGIERRALEIRVKGSSDQLLEEVLINGTTDNVFCQEIDPITLQANLIAGAPAGVTYQWFSDNNGTPEIMAAETNASLSLTGLAAGDHIYYVQLTADEYCTAEPTAVNFTINRNATDADINLDGPIVQCVGVPVVLIPSTSITNPVFNWYLDENKTTLINDGDIDGAVTYNISASGELTISGLADGDDVNYYVTVSGDEVCENVLGKEINVQVSNNLPAPTLLEADLELCGPGNDAVFEITNYAGGLSYKIFDAATGGTEITTDVSVVDNMITIGNVNADANYFIEVTGAGGCIGVDRSEISITINGFATDADIDAAGGTICEGDTFSLTASSSTVTNPVFTWYTDAGLTNEFTDLEVSPTTTTTYYVTVSGDGICENQPGDAKEVTVTVNRNATAVDIDADGGTICEGDTFSLTASSSTVTNAVFTWYTDASLTTVLPDTDVTPTATTTYYVTVSGDGVCENKAGDAKEVTVTVNRNATSVDIDADGGTICEGGTFSLTASSSTVTNAVFTWYTDASLTTVLPDTDVTPTATTTYYVTVSGDGVCANKAGDAKEVTVTVNRNATAVDIDAANSTICEGDTFSLTASSSTVTNPIFSWYADPALTILITNTEVNPSVTTSYYVTVSGDGVCENKAGDAKEVTVTVNRNATAVDIDADGGTICEGGTFSLTASSSTVTNAVFTWYTDAALTTVLPDTDVTPTATTTYYVTVSGDGVCENQPGDAKEVTVTVNRNATAVDIDAANSTICEGDTYSLTASSSTVTNAVFTWYTDANLTTVLPDTDVTPTATTTYYVTVSGDGVCANKAGDAKEVTVTVNRDATSVDIDADGGTICEGDTFSLTASSSTVTNAVFTWYTDAALTTVLPDTDVTPTATTTYYVTVSGDGVCENKAGDAKEVTVTVNRNATAVDIDAANSTICEGGTFSLTASSGTVTNAVFTWYTDANLTTVLPDTDVTPTATTTYYVTVSGDGVCENQPGDAKEVTVTVNRNATAVDIDADGGTICEGDTFSLTASSSTVTNAVFTWYTDAALTTVLPDTDVTPTTTTTYYVTVSGDGVCENQPGDAKEVTVTVNRNATAVDIDADGGTICEGDTFSLTASSSTVTNAVFTWYTDASLTTVLPDTDVTPTTTTTYYVAVSGDGVCANKAGDAKEVTVTVNRNATSVDIDADGGTICEGDTFSLTASSGTVTNAVFTWYTDAALTTVLPDTDVTPTTTTTYYVAVSGDGVCANKAGDAKEVTVTVNRNATSVDIDADGGTICEGDTFSLTASSGTVTNAVFTWYTDANLTTVLPDTDVTPTATTTYYVTVSGDGVCANKAGDAKEVTVTVNRNATAVDIDADGGTICEGDTFSLTASSSTVTNAVFTWYTDAALTTVLPDTDVTPTATTTYYVTVSGDGVCENKAGDAKEVTVTVNRNATAVDIDAANSTICEGGTFSLTASSSTVTNAVFTWYTDANLTTVLPDTDVTPTATTTYYVTVSGDGVCENQPGDAKEVTVTVNRNATAVDIDADGGTICEGDTFSLTASSSTVTNAVFTWYTDAALTTVLPDTDVTPTTTTTYYVAVSGDGVCANKAGDAKEVTVTVNRNATSVDIDADGGTICEGDTFSLTASSGTVTNAVFTWYTDAALTTVLPDTDVTPTATTTYYVTVSGDGVCENKAGDAKEVTVTVNRNATAVDIDADGGTICEGGTFSLTASSSTVTNAVFTWYTDASLITVLPDTDVTPTMTTTYYVTVSGDGVCANKAGDAKEVTVIVNSVAAPTTDMPIQSFCTTPNATISALQVNEERVVWYDAVSGGNLLNPSDVVIPGMTYYAAQIDLNNGCESIERLPVMVSECAALDVEKVADVSAVIVGEMFAYTITVSNNGAVTANNVVVTDEVPASLQILTVDGGGEIAENVVTWNIVEILPGESVTLTISVMAVEVNEGVVNTAKVEGDNSMPDEDDTDPLPILPDDVDLTMAKTVSNAIIEVDKEFTYQLKVTNNTNVPARNVIVTDYMPSQVDYLGSDAPSEIQETYDASSGTLTFVIPELAGNEEITIHLRVIAREKGLVTNSATVETPDQLELNDLDNTATISHNQLAINIPNVFTPNGDGINDVWEIEGLSDLYPDNEVIVVNRWGGEVFKSSSYNNDWDGGSLNGGTYYYKLKIRDSESGSEMQFTGYVTIIR
ncbi:gliding motility-associated C-terminal domain-containing protein [Echinicola marina]|uniref:Ig-like domain-containing protein n=1 Tax=Echinicola marina TaxID=2859768 RepID=UPI001CF6B813|nr:gliding motility-associated C-terminal domain-containing protein [Echinicola marina]UCS95459.1 gliding motility-associated C-terminal domain-containing protein [Echinicola marina]